MHALVAGSAIDAPAIVADLPARPWPIDRGDQMQVDRSSDPGHDDVADLDPCRIS
jgi:hypothetical protein